MGTAASREHSIRPKIRRKLPSLRSQKSKETDINSSTSSKPPSIAPLVIHQPTPVKHQVVLSDHVSPVSSLSAVVSIPIRRSSWRKSIITTATRTINDNTSITSSSYFDDEDDEYDVDISPRTSVGSEEHHRTLLKADHADKKKKKKSSPTSFSSIKSGYKKDGNDIVFESTNLNSLPLSTRSLSEDRFAVAKRPPRPFWSYNNGDEREYDRQLRQHYVLKHVLNGNIHVPIPTDKPITVLDVACGAGFWTLDMAHTYPNAKIIGLDAFPSDDKRLKGYASATINSPNIVYKYGDLTTHLSLPDNYIDIIYQRDTTPILPHEGWPFLFRELKRVLKPGGYIEIVEYDFNVRDPGPVLALVNEWYKIASTSVGVDPLQAKHLKELLVSEDFEDVTRKVVSIPIGEWPEDKAEQEKGFLYKNVIRALFKSMRPWWVTELAVTEEEYDKVMTAAMDELDEQRCSMDWVIYTARKPLSMTDNPNKPITTTHNHHTTITFADTTPTISTKT